MTALKINRSHNQELEARHEVKAEANLLQKRAMETLALTVPLVGLHKLRELGLRNVQRFLRGLAAIAATGDHIPLEAVHLQKRAGGTTIHNKGRSIWRARSLLPAILETIFH